MVLADALAIGGAMAKDTKTGRPNLARDEEGAIGYIAAWLLGIPASVLFIIFLMRGCT
jgi:hypothetical protein